MTPPSRRRVSLLAGGGIGLSVAHLLRKDRRVEVVSVFGASPELRRELHALYPRAERVANPAAPAYAASCRRLGVEVMLSAHCPVIVPQKALDAAGRAYNLHSGLLPWGRGYWPTYWALAEGSPAGATLHRMVAKADRGPVVAQVRVPVLATDDGEALTRRVQEAELAMFRKAWPAVRDGRAKERAVKGRGTYHAKAEGIAVRRLKRSDKTTVGALLDLLRAFTDSRFDGCWVEERGKRVYLKLSLVEK